MVRRFRISKRKKLFFHIISHFWLFQFLWNIYWSLWHTHVNHNLTPLRKFILHFIEEVAMPIELLNKIRLKQNSIETIHWKEKENCVFRIINLRNFFFFYNFFFKFVNQIDKHLRSLVFIQTCGISLIYFWIESLRIKYGRCINYLNVCACIRDNIHPIIKNYSWKKTTKLYR